MSRRRKRQEIQEIEVVIPELEEIPDITPRRYWSDWEISVLKKYYGRKSPEAIAQVINRTVHAVREKARYLGLSYWRPY